MSKLRSIDYIPPNHKEKALYETVTDVFDKTLDIAYYTDLEALKNIYNPRSDSFVPEHVLKALGAETLSNLLSNVVDRKSLSLIISDIHNIKGTIEGFETILRLLKMQYKELIFTTLANGCTEVTVVFHSDARIELQEIIELEKFANEVFPLCVTLTGITNCFKYTDSIDFTGKETLNLSQHRVDKDFVLGMSRLSRSYGKLNKEISNTIVTLLCNFSNPELVIPDDNYTISCSNRRFIIHDVLYKRDFTFLSRNFYLDEFDSLNYHMINDGHIHKTHHDLVWDYSGFDNGRIINLDFTLEENSGHITTR